VVFKVTAMWNYFGGILKCHISIISVEFSRDESHNTCLLLNTAPRKVQLEKSTVGHSQPVRLADG
jgi:hypothetical protein